MSSEWREEKGRCEEEVLKRLQLGQLDILKNHGDCLALEPLG